MRTFQQSFSGEWPIQALGSYFRVIAADGVVNVRLYRSGYPVAESIGVGVGFWVRPAGGFDRVDIVSDVLQTVKVGVSDGDGGYDAMTIVGDVKTSPKSGTECNQLAPVTVGVARVKIADADPLRRELRIRNAGGVDVYVGADDVTVEGGALKIAPGEMWIESGAAAIEWHAIAAVADNELRLMELR